MHSVTTGDPYVVLGVRRNADAEELKAAYYRKVNAAAGTGSVATVERLDAAYELLRNPQRRRVFDQTGTLVDVPRLAWEGARVTPGRNWSPAHAAVTPTRAGRARRGVTGLSFAVVAALTATAWHFGVLPLGTRNAVATLRGDFDATSLHSGKLPPLHLRPRPRRLMPHVAPPTGSGGYAVLDARAATPTRWDPCRAITYVISGAEPWPGADAMLRDAIAEVSRDTGLEFRDGGTTSELPSTPRPAYQPERYGGRWAPVLIAWSDPATDPRLAGAVAGYAGPVGVAVNGDPRYVTGVVSYDAPQLIAGRSDIREPNNVREVLLHELGHLVGLGHYILGPSVMAPSTNNLGAFSAGDLRGLAAMGAGKCFVSG